jgi:hypothetical protein
MNKNQRHHIIAYFLIAIMTIPSLWQLEHVFDNDHGIVYYQLSGKIHKVSDSNCGSLHKSLQFVYWDKIPVITTFSPQNYSGIIVQKDIDYHYNGLVSYLLRAPPFCS